LSEAKELNLGELRELRATPTRNSSLCNFKQGNPS